jgi:hypothetical protein
MLPMKLGQFYLRYHLQRVCQLHQPIGRMTIRVAPAD